jgi:hypothetical protein
MNEAGTTSANTAPWLGIAVLLLALAVAIYGVLRNAGDNGNRMAVDLASIARRARDGQVPLLVYGGVGVLWAIFLLVFLVSALGMVWVLFEQPKTTDRDRLDVRWTLLTITALTAGLSAVIALPFTLLRTHFNRRSTDAEEEGLLTDRINKAVEGLGAQKEVNRLGRTVTFSAHRDFEEHEQFEERKFEWIDERAEPPPGTFSIAPGDWQPFAQTLPNLEVRIGALYALERIAQRNIEEVHVQIMEILCAYIRENAPAKDDPDEPEDWLKESEDDGPLEDNWKERRDAYAAELEAWLEGVEPRTDIQVALEIIGRRTPAQREAEARSGGTWNEGFVFDRLPEDPETDNAIELYLKEIERWRRTCLSYSGYRLDLRKSDLRGAALGGLNFAAAKLDRARLQGAHLRKARLQGASFIEARLQGAWLREARLQGAWLEEAQMQDAYFKEAQMQGAWFEEAQMQGAWLIEAQLQRAYFKEAQMQGARLTKAQMQGARLIEAQMQGAWLEEARLQGLGSQRRGCKGPGS